METDQLIEDTETTTDSEDYQEPEVYNEYDQSETSPNVTEGSKFHEESVVDPDIIESSNKTEQNEEDYDIFESPEDLEENVESEDPLQPENSVNPIEPVESNAPEKNCRA